MSGEHKDPTPVLESIVVALEGIASTFVGLQGVIPQKWIIEDCQNITAAREALDEFAVLSAPPAALDTTDETTGSTSERSAAGGETP